jgi:hypothetical protein
LSSVGNEGAKLKRLLANTMLANTMLDNAALKDLLTKKW